MPQTVDSVINDITVGRGVFIAHVSGGVRVDPDYMLKTDSFSADADGELAAQRSTKTPPAPQEDRWWWD